MPTGPAQGAVVTFDKGAKVVTHPTGVISRYTIADLEQRKAKLLQQKAEIEAQIARLDADAENCRLTLGPGK